MAKAAAIVRAGATAIVHREDRPSEPNANRATRAIFPACSHSAIPTRMKTASEIIMDDVCMIE